MTITVTPAADVAARANAYAANRRAPRTWKAYADAWRTWQRYAAARGYPEGPPIHPDHLVAFLTDAADGQLPPARAQDAGRRYRPSTLRLIMVAIAKAHQLRGLPSPTLDPRVQEVAGGIWRTLQGAQQRRVRPIFVEHLKIGARYWPDDLHGLRDRAAALLCWAAALRAADLVALNVEDVAFDDDGLILTLRRSKASQDEHVRRPVGYGQHAGTCPVGTLKAWMTRAGRIAGPLFLEVAGHDVLGARMTTKTVERIAKRLARLCGFNPTLYGAHSFRHGAATAMHLARVDSTVIAGHLGHSSLETTRRYLQDPDLRIRPTAGLGL